MVHWLFAQEAVKEELKIEMNLCVCVWGGDDMLPSLPMKVYSEENPMVISGIHKDVHETLPFLYIQSFIEIICFFTGLRWPAISYNDSMRLIPIKRNEK